jgi:hypothetical protein
VLDVAYDGIFVCDLDDVITYCNRAQGNIWVDQRAGGGQGSEPCKDGGNIILKRTRHAGRRRSRSDLQGRDLCGRYTSILSRSSALISTTRSRFCF